MKKIISTMFALCLLIGSLATVNAAEIWWNNPNTHEGVDSGISDMLKIQTPDGKLQAYCIFNFNTGAIEYFDPICDKSNAFAFYIPSTINNVKVTGINDQALCGIFYSHSMMWSEYMGYTEAYIPSSITQFGDMSFYSGFITDDGYTICCEENSAAYKAASHQKRKVSNVTEYAMNSVIDWEDYATLMRQLTDGIEAPHRDIKVLLNGEQLYFDQPPIIKEDRTLVPLRAIFEALGANVDWNQDTQTVTANKDEINISMTIGSNTMQKNNSSITLDVSAQIVNDRTLVPARAIAEAFGCNVEWNGDEQTVTITN